MQTGHEFGYLEIPSKHHMAGYLSPDFKGKLSRSGARDLQAGNALLR